MRKKVLTGVAVVLLFLTPLLIHRIYVSFTRLPPRAIFATGPVNGEWQKLSQNLLEAIESKHPKVNVEPFSHSTLGALHHLELLNNREVDFALYMRGSRRLQRDQFSPGRTPMFVGNLYSDMTLFVVRRDLYEAGRLQSPAELADLDPETSYRVGVGRPPSGEHSIAEVILSYYLGDDRQGIEQLAWDYEQVEAGFQSKELDAAFVTAGHQAPIYQRLLEADDGLCMIGEIPEVDAIIMKNVGLAKVTVPRGLFRFQGDSVPDQRMTTVSSRTMLLTHGGVSSQMVGAIATILLSDDFTQENQLSELFQRGAAFAVDNPEFEIHPGAQHVYDPGLKPLVDPEFIDATENFRSFGVSLLIGGFLAYRWYVRTRERRKDHRLDEYFAELMAFDNRALATFEDEHEAERLQETLNRVTALRDEALSEFSAKDFDEDNAADSFLNLCDSVSDGIRSRLLRWQLRHGLQQLEDRIKELR